MNDRAQSFDPLFPRLGVGIGLRPKHYSEILETLPPIPWFEAISENFIGIVGGTGARPLRTLEEFRSHYPIALHGVSLSLGSADPLSTEYLKKLKALIERIDPFIVSDHLCWTGVGGKNLHDLLPLPYTREALDHVAERVIRVQEFLGRRMLVENVSSYLEYQHSEMTEWEFLAQVAEKADCGILLDVNNIYVSSVNHDFDPLKYLDAMPPARVGQFHLAGHMDRGDLLIDTHDHPVRAEVWDLYREALLRFGHVSTLIEWDDNIPSFEVLKQEADRAVTIGESL